MLRMERAKGYLTATGSSDPFSLAIDNLIIKLMFLQPGWRNKDLALSKQSGTRAAGTYTAVLVLL